MSSGDRVLVVEDEPGVRSVLKAMLTDAGFQVITAKDGASALRELWRRGGDVRIVVTDVDMGRMDGMELAESVRSQYPAVPILFISGLPVPASELERAVPGTTLLTKPFGPATLVEAIQKAIAKQAGTAE